MDRECVPLLPRVCEVLAASGSSLPDDTSLEKLLDWFTVLTEAGECLLEACPCLLEFISTVIQDTASAPSVLSFTLRLTGLLAAAEDGFRVLQACSVLDQVFSCQHLQEIGLWEDPCIRIGWIQGLRTMLQHLEGLSFFVQADFIEPLLELQTDTSLFVASAANQMLAHILLFCQPASSVGCSGTDKKEDDQNTCASVTVGENSADSMKINQDCTPVVVAISEYFKRALVIPKGSTQVHQCNQTLRLLALLLRQTKPPLQDKLLQTVTASLEELVMADCSQLTLPLMDVILAACSCTTDGRLPDQRVTRFLTFMLNVRKPADLVHAAAAFLHNGQCDCVHTAQSVRLLLLPLDIISGLNLIGTNAAADEHRISMTEQLKSKTSCISIIGVCLTNTPQVAVMDPDCLPCPPVLIVAAVLSLLRFCSGDSSSSSAGCSEVFRNVIGSGKVQKCALEALAALSNSPGVKVQLTDVFTLLIHCLDSPDSDPTVLHKSYQALVKWMSVCTDISSIKDQLRQDLIQVVKKRACDMRWEVRDSTVEFLGHLAGVRVCHTSSEEACGASEALLGGCCCTTPLLREALQDPESYVRASAIKALAQTVISSWQERAAPAQEQAEIVTRLLEILSQDTEGFARRAVVQFFIAWFSSHSSHTPPSSPTSSSCSLLMQSVRSVLSRGSADLDWEVKVHTLELAELLLDKAFSGHLGYTKGSDTHPAQPHPYAAIPDRTYALHTHTEKHTQDVESDLVGVLNSLVEQGVISALLSGLVDCDRPVGLKACRLLITLREAVCPPSQGDLDVTAATAPVSRVSCELPGAGWAQEIRKILGVKNEAHTQTNLKRANVAYSEDCGEKGVSAASHAERVSLCEVLGSLGLDERLDILTRSSDHVHNSPLSLLQDILTASTPHTHANTQTGQEVIVDCY
ncbi:integrator complex assembly factor BRAT1 isoform X2 [Archocentrus centrarchus]|uniref:integrator complex assembly factor BRAT1 isoform X2 n=1 Tax=Archocentrus centrarchus TaxID=63155 RepID=UPI0011E9B4E6|nr:BRCA1-associated ATM activator 1 isoform X2 [Archocentrus centrarchus]